MNIAGLDLAEQFWHRAVGPVVADHGWTQLCSAALFGTGSEVLGLDDRRSTDHDWGPRLQLLLPDSTSASDLDELARRLEDALPAEFAGRPVRFPLTSEPAERHRVEVSTRAGWFDARLGFDPLRPIRTEHWLSVPTWRLGEVVAGRVFHDPTGELTRSRAALAWYPDDVWRWMLAAQWRRIAQEEAFPGRCAERGDQLGATVVVARLAREVMRLWLLAARVHPPYSKWLGTAFARLPGTDGVVDDLRRALAAGDWPTQERHLGAALVATARRQNTLALTEPVAPTLRPYYDRPFLVLRADRFADALVAGIADPALRRLPLVGVCDQYIDSTDALGRREVLTAATRALLGLDGS